MDWQQYYLQGMEFLFLGLGTWFDVRSQRIPILFFSIFGVWAIVWNVIGKYQGLSEILPGVCIGAAFLWISWITKEAIGYGDGLGILILGIFMGWQGMLPIVFAAFGLSSIYGIYRLVSSKGSYEDTMPFFPFLLIALLGVILL